MLAVRGVTAASAYGPAGRWRISNIPFKSDFKIRENPKKFSKDPDRRFQTFLRFRFFENSGIRGFFFRGKKGMLWLVLGGRPRRGENQVPFVVSANRLLHQNFTISFLRSGGYDASIANCAAHLWLCGMPTTVT